MIPIGGPVFCRSICSGRPHGNNGIEKPTGLADDMFEFADMRLRQIPLIGRGFDQVDREGGQHQPPTGIRLAIDRQWSSTVLLDVAVQSRYVAGRRRGL